MVAQQDQQEALHGYVLKHVAEGGDTQGKFTSSLPQFKTAFANLEAAGLVVTEPEGKWVSPPEGGWDTPMIRYQTAHITDLGLAALQEDGRTFPELYADMTGQQDA
jgi:hypothetical protein